MSSGIEIAEKCAELGFPIAGFIEEIYEDAVICIPPIFSFEWDKKPPIVGRVVHIQDRSTPMTFVMLTEHRTQIPCMYGYGYSCYFALPENTENFCVV